MAKLFIITLILTSCASNYRAPESFGEKMERYSAKSKSYNSIPKTYVLNMNYQDVKRKPASVGSGKKMMNYSNSSLYFLSLYAQFKQIQKLSEKQAGTLKNCPHFHGEFLQVEKNHLGFTEGKVDYANLDKNLLNDENFLAKNPAFLLPLSDSKTANTVLDKLKTGDLEKANKLIEDALLIQQLKVLSELEELCEDGYSDNYYAYQNLITYTNTGNVMDPSKDSMKILLKTSLFYNMTLIESLKANAKKTSRSISSVKEEGAIDNQLLYRMKVDWASDYLKNIQDK